MRRAVQQDEKGRRYYQLDENLKRNSMAYLPGPISCTTTISIDMTEAESFRKTLEKEREVRLSVTSLIIKAAANVLVDFPILCGSWESMDRIRCPNPEEIDMIGPVQVGDTISFFFIEKANQKTLVEISKEMESQANDMKSGRRAEWPQESVLNPSFCISNVGTIGPIEQGSGPVAWFSTSILGVGAILEKPAVREGQIMIRKIMNVSLAWDHRAMMANTPIEFLTQLKRNLEEPFTYLT